MIHTVEPKTRFKQYKANKIKLVLDEKALQAHDTEAYKKEKLDEIKSALNISRRLGAILNNTFSPGIEELVIIASVLEVTLDELVVVE